MFPPQTELKRITTAEAKAHAGQVVKVCGELKSVKSSRGRGRPTFLNFEDFTGVIWQWQRHRFIDLQTKIGRQVCVSGQVRLYQDRVQMTLTKAEQFVSSD